MGVEGAVESKVLDEATLMVDPGMIRCLIMYLGRLGAGGRVLSVSPKVSVWNFLVGEIDILKRRGAELDSSWTVWELVISDVPIYRRSGSFFLFQSNWRLTTTSEILLLCFDRWLLRFVQKVGSFCFNFFDWRPWNKLIIQIGNIHIRLRRRRLSLRL